jgi:hypothetical protein
MDKNKKHYKNYPKKLKLSSKDDRDYKLNDIDLDTSPKKVVKVMKGKPLPKKYKSLIIKNKYVFDQEETGMCVACSLAQMWHIMTRLLNHTSIKFSPAKVYSDRELKDGEDGYGMTAREAISNTINHGICSFPNFKTIAEYPKVRKQYLKFKSQLDNISKYFRADTYYTCNGLTQKETIQNIKKAVKATGCCLVVVPCYENCGVDWYYYDDEAKKTPIAYISDYEEDESFRGELLGYHAMVCYGWDDNEQALWLVNSYSEDWGTNGKALLHYNFPIEESWAIVTHKHKLTLKLKSLLKKKYI